MHNIFCQMTRRGFGKILASAMLSVTFFGNALAQDPIKLGAPIPLTGYFAADGITMAQAIKLAVKEINADGGVLGRQVEVITFDIGDLTPDKLTAAAANLIEREGANVLINGYGGMGPDIPAFCPYGVPYIHNNAVTSVIGLAERMNCGAIFNASDVDTNYGHAVFKQMMGTGFQFKTKRLAIVHGDFEWDINLAKGLADAAEAAGWEVVFTEQVPYDTVEWTGILSKIREAKPSLIYLEALEPAVATTFIAQLHDNPAGDALLNIGYIGATPGVDEVIAQGGSEGVLSFTLNAHFANASGDAFVDKWRTEHGGEPPVSLAAAIYDMVYIWANAAEKAGDVSNYKAVADAIRTLDYAGLTGTYSFNERNFINTGDAAQPAQLFQVQNNKRVRLMIGSDKVGEIREPVWGK